MSTSKINRTIYRLWHNQSSTGRIGYVGRDKYFPNRVRLTVRKKDKECRKLSRALNKYPLEVWHIAVLASGFNSDKALHEAEIAFIAKFDSKNKGYNLTDGGNGSPGRKFSEATKRKMSRSKAGNKNPNWKRTPSAATRRKQSEAFSGSKNPRWGVPLTVAEKKHLSEANKGANNAFYGRKHSAETRRKLRASQLGRKASAETRIKMSEAHKKEWHLRKLKEAA